jgi:hypothetical protein
MANKNDRKSINRYNEIHKSLKAPEAVLPTKKDRWNYINKKRIREIIEEIFQSRSEFLITLGEQPLKWFLKSFNQEIGNLLNTKDYGTIKEAKLESIHLNLIPLFNPRQLLKEKNRESRVGLLHYDWMKNKARKIKLI